MKKLMLLSLLSTFIFYSCSDDDSCTTCKEDNGNLVTPDLSVTLSDTQSPMTGVLEAYPAIQGRCHLLRQLYRRQTDPLSGNVLPPERRDLWR